MSESKELAAAVMARLLLTITAVFVPFSQSRNKAEKHKSLNWIITLLRDGRPVLSTDYMAGSAHCPGDKAQQGDSPSGYEKRQRIDYECEHGKAAQVFSWGVQARSAISKAKPNRIMPDSVDVLCSLVLDASVLDYGSFERWADEYSYDSDSRTAEAIYRACLDTALKLREGIGDAGLSELRAAFQDY